MYGLLRPADIIQPYRLDFGTKINVGSHNSLYKFWGDRVRGALLEDNPSVVVNAASDEYWTGVGESALRESGVRVVTVSFREGIGKGSRVIAVHAKLARGMFVRFMCQNRCASVESLKEFSEANYAFDDKLSSKDLFVFTRASAPKKSAGERPHRREKAEEERQNISLAHLFRSDFSWGSSANSNRPAWAQSPPTGAMTTGVLIDGENDPFVTLCLHKI